MFDKQRFATNTFAGLFRRSLFLAMMRHVVILRKDEMTISNNNDTLSRILTWDGR
jgi:hypothetical protein